MKIYPRLLQQLAESFIESPAMSQADTVDLLLTEMSERVTPLIARFREEGRTSSPTFKFWDDFLQKVLLPFKLFIIGTRCGDWKVYEAAKANLLPILFASNRTVYSRYMPILILQMKRLSPSLTQSFKDGLFVAKLSQGNFNAVWMDDTLEVTENKVLKGAGGIIGLTL